MRSVWIGMFVGLLLLPCAHAQSADVTLTGIIQGANGLPASNTVLSFTPSQTFFIVGSGSTPVTGVSSFSGDGQLLSNMDSTGDVTATLANAPEQSIWGGPRSGGSGAPGYQQVPTLNAANMFNFPTLNQNTTGNAATATNASAVDGVFVSGTPSAGQVIIATGPTTAMWSGAPSAGIAALTGPVTTPGGGSGATTITPTGVTAGSYNLGGQVVNVNNAGQITAIGNPFAVSITSCSACGSFEVGNATTNPATFTFSYANGTVSGATLTDGTNNVTLTTPFTSGQIAASYCTAGQALFSATFTVNATATNGQNASEGIGVNCQYRTFGGVGTVGATGATASGTSAVLVGATGMLGTLGLGVNTGTFTLSPSSQYLYFLLSTSGHTFKVNGFGTTFSSTSITFVNAFGASVPMTLYTSPTFLSGTFSVEVD